MGPPNGKRRPCEGRRQILNFRYLSTYHRIEPAATPGPIIAAHLGTEMLAMGGAQWS